MRTKLDEYLVFVKTFEKLWLKPHQTHKLTLIVGLYHFEALLSIASTFNLLSSPWKQFNMIWLIIMVIITWVNIAQKGIQIGRGFQIMLKWY